MTHSLSIVTKCPHLMWGCRELLNLQRHPFQHPTRPVVLTPFWWMCHFSTFVPQPHSHFTAAVLFSQASAWLEVPLLLWAPSVVLLPLQLWPPVWTGVQFQSAITLDTKTKGSRGSLGPMEVLASPLFILQLKLCGTMRYNIAVLFHLQAIQLRLIHGICWFRS